MRVIIAEVSIFAACLWWLVLLFARAGSTAVSGVSISRQDRNGQVCGRLRCIYVR